MNTDFLPCVMYPTTVILVDDDEMILDYLKLELNPHFNYVSFESAQDAKNYIQKNHQRNRLSNSYITHQESSEHEKKSLSIDVRALLKEQTNPHRHEDISILITDYAMPGINGLELCQSTCQTIRKILLTGEADTQTAIDAFNNRLIQQYIRKDQSDFISVLNDALLRFRKSYFMDQTQFLAKSLIKSRVYPTTCLGDKNFIDYFNNLISKLSIKEYYLCDSRGCFLLIDENQKPYWLATATDRMLDDFSIFAEEDEASDHIVSSIKNKNSQPFFFTDDDYTIRPNQWEKYLNPITTIVNGQENYYCSLIQDSKVYLLEK